MRCVHVYRLALSSTPSLVILFFYRNKKQLLKKRVTRILHSSTVCGCTHHLGASTGTGGSTEPTYERASVSDNSVSSPSPSSHPNFVFLSTPEHTDGGAPPPKKRTQKGRSTLSASSLSLSRQYDSSRIEKGRSTPSFSFRGRTLFPLIFCRQLYPVAFR